MTARSTVYSMPVITCGTELPMATPMLSQPSEPPDELVADIRARLGRICQDYTADEFTELVRQIASIRAKYDALRAETFFEAAQELAAERRAARGFPAYRPESMS